MLCDDLFLSTAPNSRLSSCSLDSVIGHLDKLLGRKESDDGQLERDVEILPMMPTEVDHRSTASGRRMLTTNTSSPIRSGCCGGPPLAASPLSDVDHIEDEDAIQRVMELSFASVYEVPSLTDCPSIPLGSACQQQVMTVVTESIEPPDSLDSGVESNKSDDESTVACSHPLSHDYQNVSGCPPPIVRPNNKTSHLGQPRRIARVRNHHHSNHSFNNKREILSTNESATVIKGNASHNSSNHGRSSPSNRPANPAVDRVHSERKDDKFYEICLGHLCLQMDAGKSEANGSGAGFDRWISIFSLQKHQDELIHLSASPSSASSSSSTANHYHQHQQPQHQSHNQPPTKRLPQRHHSSGGGSGNAVISNSSRQGSQDDSVINSSRNNTGKDDYRFSLLFIVAEFFFFFCF